VWHVVSDGRDFVGDEQARLPKIVHGREDEEFVILLSAKNAGVLKTRVVPLLANDDIQVPNVVLLGRVRVNVEHEYVDCIHDCGVVAWRTEPFVVVG